MSTHILQSPAWAAVRKLQGQRPLWIDSTLVLIKDLSPFPKNMGMAWQVDMNKVNWSELVKQAKQHKLSHVQLDPANLKGSIDINRVKATLIQTTSLIMRHNVVIDLTKSEEQLLAAMKSKFRYNIKLGIKHGVKVDFRTDEPALEIFLKLFFQTVSKQKYFGRNPDYYRQIWQTLLPQNKVLIAIASYNGQPLSAWMLFKDGEALYYPYGGSSDEHREVMANNVLVWEVMQWAKQNGFKSFDLWGIHKPRTDGKDDGYTRFKLGIGGDVVEYAPSYDLVIDWFWYIAFRLANSLRWLALKLNQVIR